MSKNVKHAYEVVENTAGGNAKVGGFLVQAGHVRREHEPYRTWQFFEATSPSTGGGVTRIVGFHVGEYEKVKKYLSGYRDSRIMRPVLEFYRDGGNDGGTKAREILPEAKPAEPYE